MSDVRTCRFVGLAAALLCLVSSHAVAGAWAPADRAPKELADYLSGLRQSRTNVFYADCEFGDHIKAAIVIPAGSAHGRYFLIGDRIADGTAFLAERGEASIQDGNVVTLRWTAESYKRGDLVLGSLVRQPFRLLLPTQFDIVFKQAPSVPCAKPAFNR